MSDQTTTIDVLHIDDDENQLFYTRQILEQFDPYLTVHSVLSSADVFDRLQLDPYDCLITDYLMPGMNGIEFAEKIRETSNIPIIIYTGRGSEEVASNAFNVGVNDYIRKETDPNHYQILARRIRAAVNKKRAEERVIQERNRAQRYLDVAGAMIVVLDVEGRISLLNQKGCEILEVSPENVVGMNWFDNFIPSHLVENVRDVFFQLMAGNTELVKFYENPVITSSGEERIISWHNALIRDYEGNILGAISSGMDITEQRKTEEELIGSEELYRSLVERSPDAISVTIGQEIVYANKKRLELTGHSHMSELIGSSGPDHILPEDREGILKRLEARERGEVIPSVTTFRMIKKDGGIIHIVDHTSDIVWEGRDAIIHILHDVTRDREMEEALRRSRDDYLRLWEDSADGLVTINPETGIILNCNKAFTIQTGRSKEELKSLKIWELRPPDQVEAAKKKFREIREKGVGGSRELQFQKPNGELVDIEFVTKAVTLDDMQVLENRSRDITYQKLYEERLGALHEYSVRLNETSTVDDVYSIAFTAMTETLGYRRCTLMVVEGDHLCDLMATGYGEDVYHKLPLDGKGVTVKAARTGETVYVPDILDDPDYIEGAPGIDVRSELIIPVIVEGSVDSVLNVERMEVDGFTFEDRELLEILAMHISTSLKRIKDEEIKRIYDIKLEALHKHATELAAVNSLKEIAEVTLNCIESVMGFQWSEFNVIRDDCLVPLLVQDGFLRSNMEIPLEGPGIIARAYRTGESQLVHDTRLDEDYVIGREVVGEEEWLSELAVPVKIRDDIVAVINIEDKKIHGFTRNDQKLMEIISEHVTSAMERLERMEALRSSGEKFRMLLEASRDAVFVVDKERYMYVNQRAAELLGFTDPDELIGRDAFTFVAPKDREKVREITVRRQKGGKVPSRYQFNLVDKEGVEIPVETNVSLIEYEGKPASLAINRSIAERKRFEKTLVDLHRYAELLRRCQSLEEVYKLTLEAMEKTLGFDRVDILRVEGENLIQVAVHKNLPTGLVLPLDGKGITVKAVRERRSFIVNDVSEDEDYVYITDPETGRKVEGHQLSKSELATPIVIDSRTLGVLNVESLRLNAFTEHDRTLLEMLAIHVATSIDRLETVGKLESLVEEKTRELLDAERLAAAGRVASMVGHDLRAPLQNIINALYLMDEKPETTAEMMKTIKKSVRYASDMLEEFRRRTSDLHLSLTIVNLETLLQDIVADSLILDYVDFKLLLGEDLGTINVDRMVFHRVLDNLLRNAVEAMPEGGELTLNCERTDDNVIIEVSDTGRGIPDELKEDIFKPFHTTKPGGMGLGLVYCKRAVEAHGGTLTFKSEVDVGTTITITLPS